MTRTLIVSEGRVLPALHRGRLCRIQPHPPATTTPSAALRRWNDCW